MSRKILVVGPPGTGKTSFMANRAKERVEQWCEETNMPARDCSRVLIATLTRGAAREAASRDINMDERQIATLHAHCFRALDCPNLIVGHKNTKSFNEYLIRDNLPNFCISPQGDEKWGATALPGDEILAEYQMMRSRRRPRDSATGELAEFIDVYEFYKQINSLMDFTDCIESCLLGEVPPPGDPDLFIVDEAQDNDALETALIDLWSTMVDLTYIIGDPDQNLYEWRGSDSANMLKAHFDERRVLSRSYRVPQAVHRVAMHIRENIREKFDITYEPRDAEGEVIYSRTSFDGKTVDPRPQDVRWNAMVLHDMAAPYIREGKSVMFVSATEFGLKDIIKAFRREGVIYWNPFSKSNSMWNPHHSMTGKSARDRLADFLRPNEADYGDEARLWTVKEMFGLIDWMYVQTEHPHARKVLTRGTKANLKRLIEKNESHRELCLDEIQQMFASRELFDALVEDRKPSWLLPLLRKEHKAKMEACVRIYDRYGIRGLTEDPKIVVGTIHSVKGGEADVVFVSPDLTRAFMRSLNDTDTSDQVHRMFYVAVTRARETLVLCGPSARSAFRVMSGGPAYGSYKHGFVTRPGEEASGETAGVV